MRSPVQITRRPSRALQADREIAAALRADLRAWLMARLADLSPVGRRSFLRAIVQVAIEVMATICTPIDASTWAQACSRQVEIRDGASSALDAAEGLFAERAA